MQCNSSLRQIELAMHLAKDRSVFILISFFALVDIRTYTILGNNKGIFEQNKKRYILPKMSLTVHTVFYIILLLCLCSFLTKIFPTTFLELFLLWMAFRKPPDKLMDHHIKIPSMMCINLSGTWNFLEKRRKKCNNLEDNLAF